MSLTYLLCSYRFFENKALSRPIQLGGSDTLKVLLTVQEDKKPKRPHQAFLHITEPTTGLETSYALAVKENGKGKVELVSFQETSWFRLRLIDDHDRHTRTSQVSSLLLRRHFQRLLLSVLLDHRNLTVALLSISLLKSTPVHHPPPTRSRYDTGNCQRSITSSDLILQVRPKLFPSFSPLQ